MCTNEQSNQNPACLWHRCNIHIVTTNPCVESLDGLYYTLCGEECRMHTASTARHTQHSKTMTIGHTQQAMWHTTLQQDMQFNNWVHKTDLWHRLCQGHGKTKNRRLVSHKHAGHERWCMGTKVRVRLSLVTVAMFKLKHCCVVCDHLACVSCFCLCHVLPESCVVCHIACFVYPIAWIVMVLLC